MASGTGNPRHVHRKLTKGKKGPDVRQLQHGINRKAESWKLDHLKLEVDGVCGPKTLKAARLILFAMGVYGAPIQRARNGELSQYAQRLLRGTRPRTAAMKALSEKRRPRVRQIREAANPLRERAYRIARDLVGVMEQGGNNTGPIVDKIIKSNGGVIGEPWCGDFVAYCYRNAGSKAVVRQWAAVRLLWPLAGVKKTTNPQRGDLVRFTFDHVGMFVKDNGDGTITTIEGNTGATGAVSDSATGGDGVYLKIRPKYLVNDYLRITR